MKTHFKRAMQTNKNHSAFPYESQQDDGSFIGEPGLTKREYFALKVLPVLIEFSPYGEVSADVKLAVRYADELIIELNKTSCQSKTSLEVQDDD